MRVLFLGGTSLTGPFAVRRLHVLGHEVTVFHRGNHDAVLPPDVRHVHGDWDNPPAEFLESAPDVVVHMRAMTAADAESFMQRFRGMAGRAVVISSGDVYRAYGRLQRLEPGPPDPALLTEDAPLRVTRYPYRHEAPGSDHWMTRYDKILVEQIVMGHADLPATVLRYPAVLGGGEYRRFQRWIRPMLRGDAELRIQDTWAGWRWTHGFAEDVAEAVVLAVTEPRAAGRVYNVGERETPTMLERLREFADAAGWNGRIVPVPAAELSESERMTHDFSHDIAYDTGRIRRELGYREVVADGVAQTVELCRLSD